jgi:hypothetical protein
LAGGGASPSRAKSPRTPSAAGPELAIVVPTLNECDKLGPLIGRLDRLLVGVDWEAVVVDDAADGTAEHLRDLGIADRRVHLGTAPVMTKRFGAHIGGGASLAHRGVL